jgi:hypothetical protein
MRRKWVISVIRNFKMPEHAPFRATFPRGLARAWGMREPPGCVALRCARNSAVRRAFTERWYAERMEACRREYGARCEEGRFASVWVMRRPELSS